MSSRIFFKLVVPATLVAVMGCACSRIERPSAAKSFDLNESSGSLKDQPGDEEPMNKPPITLDLAAAKAAKIRHVYGRAELPKLCQDALTQVKARIDAIVALPSASRTFGNTMLEFEAAMADLNDRAGPLTFMAYVSTDKDLRDEASACEEEIGQFYPTLMSNKALYEALKSSSATTAEEKRLASETLRAFEKSGMNLDDATLAKVTALKQELSTAQTQFSENLNADNSTVEFTAAELKGVSAAALGRMKKTANGAKYIVTTKSTDYTAVMENAESPATRKALYFAYNNRAASVNTPLIEKAIVLRAQIAKLLGYATWADYQIDGRMGKSAPTVLSFLEGLKEKLAIRNKADLDALLAYKKTVDASATQVDPWDVNYLANQVKKRDHQLDDELIADYFPADTVMAGMFSVYSTLFNVTFLEVPKAEADAWEENVKMYQIIDNESGLVRAHFFIDSKPREGKYSHAAAFPLIAGRIVDGKYSQPVASVVCNFTPAAENGSRPSLLTHDEVNTLFHEFGHIMHQTLTRAPYASQAGSSVAQDFVEAPSQMLENWVWDEGILNMLSGHYATGEKLPRELREKMIAARDFNQGYAYTRQLLFGLFDMKIHTSKGESVDVTKTYDDMFREISGLEPAKGTHFVASFGHLMGGYDAGYYGYLWSEVYANDMFSRFAKEGLLNPKTGLAYREVIQAGNMKDPFDLLRAFLGREPNSDAFYKRLGL